MGSSRNACEGSSALASTNSGIGLALIHLIAGRVLLFSALALCFVAPASAEAQTLRVSGTFGEDFDTSPGDELTIVNRSSGGLRVASLTFDLVGADDVVFDPNSGINELIPLVGDSGFDGAFDYTDGFVAGSRTVYRRVTLRFSEFDPGETVRVLIDADSSNGSASFVSASQFSGATLTASSSSNGLAQQPVTATYKQCNGRIVVSEAIPGEGSIVGMRGLFLENFTSGGDEFTLINQSEGEFKILSLAFDLNPSDNVVFDPNGVSGGEPGVEDLLGNSGFDESFIFSDGFVNGARTVYRKLDLAFNDFDPDDEISIGIDVDSDSGEEAFVTGQQLAGSTLVGVFDDGTLNHQVMGNYEACSDLANVEILALPIPIPILGGWGTAWFVTMLLATGSVLGNLKGRVRL